jgi:RHS repeat-associated protein
MSRKLAPSSGWRRATGSAALRKSRRWRPTALLTLATIVTQSVTAPVALAQTAAVSRVDNGRFETHVAHQPALGVPQSLAPQGGSYTTEIAGSNRAAANAGDTPSDTLASLPVGGTDVSPQATALPTGPSSQLGMGESFSAQLSTGTASYSIPIHLPAARGKAQARLSLSYSSGGGYGIAGQGWQVGVPAIGRQTDRGTPKYDDRATWHAEQDSFVMGGVELVPICTVQAGSCTGALPGEVMPAWANGWQYFRARVESAFLRFYWSPNHLTWRVQAKDGFNLEFGQPLDGSASRNALQASPDEPNKIHRWHLSRQYDCEGNACLQAAPAPTNVIVYKYRPDGDTLYLSDIFDTPAPGSTDLRTFAHHTALSYELRPDIVSSYRSGWLAQHRLRLARIDVSSKSTTGAYLDARAAVRRYHLTYDSDSHTSLLKSVQLEGRCETPTLEGADQTLPPSQCPRLHPSTFEYQRVAAANPLADGRGYKFEPIAEQIKTAASSPPHSLSEAMTSLADVWSIDGQPQADGLPDVLVTAPGLFAGAHGVFVNTGPNGTTASFEANPRRMTVLPAGDVTDAGVLSLHSSNVVPLDLDADGIINLVHMPYKKTYSVFKPEDGKWVGRAVTTTSGSAKIDFTADARNTAIMDVNGDGLVDVVFSGATGMQTFFSLGQYPGGEDRFGNARRTGPTTADISDDPVTACLPWSAVPVRFSDPDVRVADMNGDGLPDLARVRSGQILYWPGRGNGFWGTGSRTGCNAGEFAVDRHVEMHAAPRFGSVAGGVLLLTDTNGDGLADVTEVRNNAVDVYLNDNGTAWTERHTILNAPFRASESDYVRIGDLDGSGSPDLIWGQGYEYQYIDLTGGVVPYQLVRIHNGLGATRDLEYESSATLMRRAADAGQPWTSFAPVIATVLVRDTLRDNLAAIGRPAGMYVTEYTYRDPVYEGRQREFRGFRRSESRTLGDAFAPTAIQSTSFLLGEAPAGLPRWEDNPYEALKGLTATTEALDESGVYLSTEHTTYELQRLYAGLDGRRVSVARPVRQDALQYDTATFDYAQSTISVDQVLVRERDGSTTTNAGSMPSRAGAGTARVRSRVAYDLFGNTVDAIRDGCIQGCPAGVDESIATTKEFALVPGDTSGWHWRETRTYVTGSVHTARRNETKRIYDSLGRLIESRQVLSGTLPLVRSHASGAQIAPAPSEASGGVSAPTEIVTTFSYDAFGNLTSYRGPNGRCRTAKADPLYAQLPIEASVFVGATGSDGCGVRKLTHSVTQDRGLNVVLTSTDARGQPSAFTYDAFGRLLSATSGDPVQHQQLAPLPALTIEYRPPSDPAQTPYAVTISRRLVGNSFSAPTYHESREFVDGLGRTILSLRQADPGAGDGGSYVAANVVDYSRRGPEVRAYQPWFYSGSVEQPFPLAPPFPTAFSSRIYDAFQRARAGFLLDGGLQLRLEYGALSRDIYDAADDSPGEQAGTPITVVLDGHGRQVEHVRRLRVRGAVQDQHLKTEYLPSGEVERVIQHTAGNADVVRWARYDSLGRVVLNAEPNTSVGFQPSPTMPLGSLQAWRYAYNDAGNVVGTSDARGCGANYHYDRGGRLLAEDRSPCLSAQGPYTPPNLTTGNGTEAFYLHDTLDPESAQIQGATGEQFPVNAQALNGKLASVSSLGSKAVFRYDFLGRSTGVALRATRPGAASASLSSRYAPRWYLRNYDFDAAGRLQGATTGATTAQLLGAGNRSELSFSYSMSGALRSISGSYGVLLASASYAADGRPGTFTLGDAAATTRAYSYDANRRVRSVQAYRAAAPLWTSAPGGSSYVPPTPAEDPTLQLLLEDHDFSYDPVGNLVRIQDLRSEWEWPASAKPVSRTFEYDGLNRLARTRYDHSGAGVDSWSSPFAAENASPARKPQPSPHVAFQGRMLEERFEYDHLGNLVRNEDDSQGFWDRSLGQVVPGTSTRGPHQSLTASNSYTGSPASGAIETVYDEAGNLTDLVVRRNGTCLPAQASCWQRFRYEWNEINQLTRAHRWDLVAGERTANAGVALPPPARDANVVLSYAYDTTGRRTLKSAAAPGQDPRHTVYVFDTLELRNAEHQNSAPTPDYRMDATTVHLHAQLGPIAARILYSQETLPTTSGGQQHVFLELSDNVGSTTIVIDKATGELVERRSHHSYGSIDSDYRPGRWAHFREPLDFGGKENDIEVGLGYFGARYYSPFLKTWISPDPVTIHELGSDLNPYAYVHGSPVMAVDPDGRLAFLAILAIAVVAGAVIGGGANAAAQGIRGGEFDWGSFWVSVGMGALAGASVAVGGWGLGALQVNALWTASATAGQVAMGSLQLGFLTAGGLAVAQTTLAGAQGQDAGQTAIYGVRGFVGGALAGVGAMFAHGTLVGIFGIQSTGLLIWGVGGAAYNGAMGGARGTYEFDAEHGTPMMGALMFSLDSSLGILGTSMGAPVDQWNMLSITWGGANFRSDLSRGRGVHVWEGGFRVRGSSAFTQGNVMSNIETDGPWGRPQAYYDADRSILQHEMLHTNQSRFFGPAFQITYGGWLIVAGGAACVATCGGAALTGDFSHVSTMAYYNNPWEVMGYNSGGHVGDDDVYGPWYWGPE